MRKPASTSTSSTTWSCRHGNGRLKLVSPQGEESFADLKHGVSYYRNAGVHHNVINANDFEFAFVEIELKS